MRDGGRVVFKPNGTNGVGGKVTRLGASDRLELADPEFERAYLWSAMNKPALLAAVRTDDLWSTSHRIIHTALTELHGHGGDTDTDALRTWLVKEGKLGNVGGDEFLLDLTAGLPRPSAKWTRIRELSIRRHLASVAALVQAKAGEPDELALYLGQLDSARAELAALDAPDRPARSLVDSILAVGAVGVRMSTGLPTLDECTRGGVPFGKVVFVLGAPGSSKTNFVTWLGDAWERTGAAVLFVAADESRDMIVTRFGQLDGFDRSRLECDDDGGRRAFAARAGKRCLDVVDPDEDRLSLEGAHAGLVAMAGERARVLIVDSLQTVRCDAAARFETKREQIDAIVDTLKGFSKSGTLVIAISEMSRAGYRSTKEADNVSALAAGAESRSIEYGAQLVLGLRPARNETGVIDIEVAKNRLGSGKPFLRMRLDFDTLRFVEIDKPDADVVQVEQEAKRFIVAREKICKALRHDTTGLLRTFNAIVLASGVKRALALTVIRDLSSEGSISKVDGVYRLTSERQS